MNNNYDYRFINQYIKIPKEVSDKVDVLYSTEKAGVRYCISMIITNLLAHGEISYSTRGTYFKKEHTEYFNKPNFKKGLRIVIQGKYAIQTVKGFKGKTHTTGIGSRIRSYSQMTQDFDNVNVTGETDINLFPYLELDDEPIFSEKEVNKFTRSRHNFLNKQTTKTTTQKQTTNILDTLPIRHCFDTSVDLNDSYFSKITLDFSRLNLPEPYLTKIKLTKVFNAEGCGRWYQKSGYSYQDAPKHLRNLLLINGYEIDELDYSATFPNIACTWEGFQAPADFYQSIMDDLVKRKHPNVTRFVVKKVVLYCIGAKDRTDFERAINKNKAETLSANKTRKLKGWPLKEILYDELKKLKISKYVIIRSFQRMYPYLANYVFSASANALMLAESEVMTDILIELQQLEIPAIPIHDSLLFPKQHRSIVKQVMLDCYRKVTGFTIQVK